MSTPTDKQIEEFRAALERLKADWPPDATAEDRYDRWKDQDPYLETIDPALLNCADFIEYVRITGMITPFHLDLEDIKFASYAMRIGGPLVYWDSDGKRRELDLLEKGDRFTLKGNSIAFVSLEPYLRIPDYIALRFNLKINNVYRGLLLGTGPLVDPGFVGRLSIPLHNLTTNDYEFEFGEKLIWVEFTKLSYNNKWNLPTSDARACDALYTSFDHRDSKNSKVYDLLRLAVKDGEVRSSLPKALDDTRALAVAAQEAVSQSSSEANARMTQESTKISARLDDSEAKAEKFQQLVEKRLEILTWATVITVLLGFAGLIGAIYQVAGLVHNAQDDVASSRTNVTSKLDQVENKNRVLEDELAELKVRDNMQARRLQNLQDKLDHPPKR